MDRFDDDDAPIECGRGRGRFQPKAKPRSQLLGQIFTSQKASLSANEKEAMPPSANMETGQLGLNDDGHRNAADSALAASSIDFQKSNCPSFATEADSTDYAVGHVANVVPEHVASDDPQHFQPSTVEESKMTNAAEEPSAYPEPSCYDWNQSSEFVGSPSQFGEYLGSADGSYMEVTEQSNVQSFLNSDGPVEAKSAAFEIDPFCDILLEPATGHVHAQARFQPKIKPRPPVATPAETAGSRNVSAESPLPSRHLTPNQVFESNYDRGMGLPESVSAPFSEENLQSLEPSQQVVPNALPSTDSVHDGVEQFNSLPGKSVAESIDIFSGLESLEDFLGQTTGNHDPSTRKSTGKNFVIQTCSFSQARSSGAYDTGQIQMLSDQRHMPSEFAGDSSVFKNGNSANTQRSEMEEVDVSNTSFTVDNEELTNAAGGLGLGDGLFSADVHEMHREEDPIRSREAGRSTCPSANCKSSTSPMVHQDGRQLRSKSNGDGQGNIDEYGMDGMLEKEKASKKSNKTVTENGKSSQKRKKTNGASEKSKEKPCRKFSHSTRHSKRYADKAFVEAMEEEIDPSTARIKDIIQYGEYHEWKAKKEAAMSRTTSSNLRNASSLHEAAQDEEEILGTEDETVPQDADGSNIPLASSFFNYHSFMEKTPRGKWTKQDTELFYDAVRQFGTDFAMIQQLFPGRDRNQIKFKYKKEERQHPLRLFEAVNGRAKDYSHFKSVIELLQTASAKSEVERRPPSVDLTGVEEAEDVSPGTNEEAAKVEQNTVENNGDEEMHQYKDVEMEKVASPLKADHESDDDDGLNWCQYTSNY